MQDLLLNLASTVAALAFVLLLAWVLIRGWRRLTLGVRGPADPGEVLRFVRALPVGTRERISLLARWPQPGTAPNQPPGSDA
jgi:flagellar protein FliO/FliZ